MIFCTPRAPTRTPWSHPKGLKAHAQDLLGEVPFTLRNERVKPLPPPKFASLFAGPISDGDRRYVCLNLALCRVFHPQAQTCRHSTYVASRTSESLTHTFTQGTHCVCTCGVLLLRHHTSTLYELPGDFPIARPFCVHAPIPAVHGVCAWQEKESSRHSNLCARCEL